MEIYHGGCHGCIAQTHYSKKYCNDCKYRKPNWNLPDLSIRNIEIIKNRHKQKIRKAKLEKLEKIANLAFFLIK